MVQPDLHHAAADGTVPAPSGQRRATSNTPDSDRNDGAILRQIARGDQSHFDEFVDRYKTRLIGFIRTRVNDQHQVEDLAQEVFMRVFRAAQDGNFREANASFAAWVFTIANNCVVDFHRERTRKPVVPESDVGDGRRNVGLIDASTANTVDPMLAASRAEEQQRILERLACLPEPQREVITLKVYGQLTFAQIADVLPCPLATVKSRMRYGLLKMHSLLTTSGSHR